VAFITYEDLFPSSTIMQQSPGNGTITVPGAGDARLVAPNSVNCQFYAADVNGKPPLLYDRLSLMWQAASPGQPIYVETKLAAFTGTTNLRIAGLTIFSAIPGTIASFFSYQLGWYKLDAKIHVWYDYPTSEVEIVTAVTAVDPASTPHLYRIYWNPYNRPLYIGELGIILPFDTLCFAFSVNAGVTWTSLGTRARDWDLTLSYAGVYCRKWETSAVNAQADFEYFRAKQFADTEYLSPNLSGLQESAGLEDQGAPITLSGPPRFDYSDVGGDVEFTPPTPVAFEDQGGLLTQGGAPRFDLPEIAAEPVVPTDCMALEEGLFVQLDNTDYIKGKLDPDGKELLGGYEARHIQLYDATADPWHTHGAGFYGAGRDGVLYYDGVACGPGSFGTLADGRRKTAWATKGDFCDIGTIWGYVIAALPTITADDEMQFALTTGQTGIGVSSRLRWFFTGDFDVQVDYQSVSVGAGPTDGGLNLIATMDPKNAIYVRRKLWGTSLYDKGVINNGSWTSYASVATTDTSGKLRLTRVGAVVAAYYWTGSAWVQIGSDYTMTYARPMYLDLYVGPAGGTANVTVKVRNFTINAGSTTNLIGWAREAAGTYRGSLAEFPQHALLVSSGNSLDIIDADTNKLWMSFRGGTNNVLGGNANYYVNQVMMKDGVLLPSYRTFDSAVLDGGGLWIDFTLDFIRFHRGPTYNDAGLIYNVELTTGVWPRDSANGAISWRNSARGFYAAHFDNWQQQNMRANWCDILHDAGSQYRLIANNGGTYLAQWVRWKFEGLDNEHLNTPWYALSTQTVAMRWAAFRPTSKDILCHNRVKLWITSYATWSVVMGGGGGTWLEDHEYSLAGSVDTFVLGALAQDSMTLDDAAGLLFYARDQGVYVMDLATGISTLLYGKVGSGATHEVLGDYATISSVKLATDGATPILIVGMARPDRIWAVNRTTHTIYWRGFQDDAHQPLSMAVG
jgi:hypothetical protein